MTKPPTRGHWDFWFCGFDYFLYWFFGFCTKKLQFLSFGVHCSLPIFRFFNIWFSVFAKNINRFSDLISDAFFGFSYLTYLGSGFSLS